jgi:RNA polymerase sigma factor (sigma-70 family)
MGPFHAWSDAQLLAPTKAGEAEAFGVFFGRHCETVLRFLRGKTGRADAAAELTAETFAAALVSVHRNNARDVVDGAPWLIGIARNKLCDSYRRGRLEDDARRQLGLQTIALGDDDVSAIDRLGGGEDLMAAVNALPEDERTALIERVILERDYEQIGRDARQSVVVIRKRVSRGLGRLRSAMGVRP